MKTIASASTYLRLIQPHSQINKVTRLERNDEIKTKLPSLTALMFADALKMKHILFRLRERYS